MGWQNPKLLVSQFTERHLTISDKLNGIFDKKVEALRLEFETEIKSQIKHSLTTILERLT